MSKNESNFSKGVFTVCQQKEGRCPPWLLQAKKIVHNKIKKTLSKNYITIKEYFYSFRHKNSIKKNLGPPCFDKKPSPFFINKAIKKYNLDLINTVSEKISIPIIACGGAGDWNDFYKLLSKTNVAGAAAANIFHFKVRSPMLYRKMMLGMRFHPSPNEYLHFGLIQNYSF